MPSISGGGGGGAQVQIFNSLLTGTAANFDVTPIAASWNHLLFVFSLRTDTAAARDNVNVTFNGDTGANYDGQRLDGVNVTASAGVATGGTFFLGCSAVGNTGSANAFGNGNAMIANYKGTAAFKSWVGRHQVFDTNGTPANFASAAWVGQWRSAVAITRVTLTPSSGGNFVAGSMLSVYGLL